MMSETERLVRAVLMHGGKVQAVFGTGLPWELVGVEEGEPRLESRSQTLDMTLYASNLEGPPKKGDTFEVSFGGDTVRGVYTDDNGSYETQEMEHE